MAYNQNFPAFTHGGTQIGTEYTPHPHQNQQHEQQFPVLSGYTRPFGQGPPHHHQQQQHHQHQQQQANQQQSANAKGFTNYDAAIFKAVSQYATQGSSSLGNKPKPFHGYKNYNQFKKRPAPPKTQTLHYCEVCKISCAGLTTYNDHVEGKNHKKKEAAAILGTCEQQQQANKNNSNNNRGGGNSNSNQSGLLKCELCDVYCTGLEAYYSHVKGAKHLKVVSLHQKLGKPIPETNPTPIIPQQGQQQTNNSNNNEVVFKKPQLPSTPSQMAAAFVKKCENGSGVVDNNSQNIQSQSSQVENTAPAVAVGEEFVEDVINPADGRVTYNCKICECVITDPVAKESHMKGRRHRISYKKKVDPKFVVDEPKGRNAKRLKERQSIKKKNNNIPPRPPMAKPPPILSGENPPPLMSLDFKPQNQRQVFYPSRNNGFDDYLVMQKHSLIYPTEEELLAIQKTVSNIERGLKLVSDVFANEEAKKNNVDVTSSGIEQTIQAYRQLKGVMRVGYLAKGLLIKGDRSVKLVVLCENKPTMALLEKIYTILPEQLKTVSTEDEFTVSLNKEDETILLVAVKDEPKIDVVVSLTSPKLRSAEESAEADDPPDLLDRSKCLESLANLRHAKFFQAKIACVQSCVIVIRVLRDIFKRVPAFFSFPIWGLELLVEKTLSTAAPMPVSPGTALKLVFEVLSSGIVLPNGPGLKDPCEKDEVDVTANLNDQERDDITAFSQLALRMITFRRMNEILGIEKPNNNRKRRGAKEGKEEGDVEKKEKIEDGETEKKGSFMEDSDGDIKMKDVGGDGEGDGDVKIKTEPTT